ncbi:MAG: hypothetical protein AAGA61_01550, partial [Pseudomonadota bacterium]
PLRITELRPQGAHDRLTVENGDAQHRLIVERPRGRGAALAVGASVRVLADAGTVIPVTPGSLANKNDSQLESV